jgi:hypothetical protein
MQHMAFTVHLRSLAANTISGALIMSLNMAIVVQEKIQCRNFPVSTEEKHHYSQYIASQAFDPGTFPACYSHIHTLYKAQNKFLTKFQASTH